MILTVDGMAVPSPTELTWHLTDISDSAAGRTEDTVMHKNRIGQKWTAEIAWSNPTAAETAQIMQMFNPEYFTVTFENPMTAAQDTRVFYRGDADLPVLMWKAGDKYFSRIAFSIIER